MSADETTPEDDATLERPRMMRSTKVIALVAFTIFIGFCIIPYIIFGGSALIDRAFAPAEMEQVSPPPGEAETEDEPTVEPFVPD